MIAALREFGAPTSDIQSSDFTVPDTFFQIGIEPVRIDILTSVTGLDFGAAWQRRVMIDFGGEEAPVLSRQDILAAKIAAGRTRESQRRQKVTNVAELFIACNRTDDPTVIQ